MQIKAVAKNIRMSAKKVRFIVDVIRGKTIEYALSQLTFINRHSVSPVLKTLKSAIANAEHNFNLKSENLHIKEVKVDEGFTIKRSTPKAFGRANPILKRSSHITIILEENKEIQK